MVQVERAVLQQHGSDSCADLWRVSHGVDRDDAARVKSVFGQAAFETSLVPLAVMRLSKDRWAILQAASGDDDQASVIQAFFVDRSTYAAFGYHPIQFLDQALLATEGQPVGDQLEPLHIDAAGELSIERHLARAIERWTLRQIAVLLDSVLVGPQVAAIINERPRSVVSALYSLLPPACRADLTCSGLTDSSAFRFDALFLTEDAACWSSLLEAGGISIYDWSSDMPITTDLIHPWSQLAVRDLRAGCIREWFDYMGVLPADLTFDDLKPLAQTALIESRETALDFEFDAIAINSTVDEFCFQQDVGSDCSPRRKGALDLSREEVLEQLDRLDDAAFDAIAGSDGGLSRLEELWPQIKSQLSANLVEESREQYVRLIVDQCLQQQQSGAIATKAAVIDVLKLLFK